MITLQIPLDSYVSLDYANQYHALRNSFEPWNALSDEQKQRRLVSASDFLDHNYTFMGTKAVFNQPRQFPRDTSGQIPLEICNAVCELALQAELNQNVAQKMTSVKVGPLAVNYDEQSGLHSQSNRFEYVKLLLNDYLEQKTVIGQVTLLRG